MAKYKYEVIITKSGNKYNFKSINKAKEFIENWGIENNQHTGKVDIDTKTIMWQVGTFKEPILQYTKTYIFNT